MKKIYLVLLSTLFFACNKEVITEKIVDKPISDKGSIVLLSVNLENHVDTLSISGVYEPKLIATYSNGYKSNISDSATITTSDLTVFKSNKSYYGAKSGKVIFDIKFKEYTFKDTVTVSEIEYVDISKFPFLNTPSNPNANIVIPVVVVNYYPTLNGIDVDTKRSPGLGTVSPITLDGMTLQLARYLE